MGCNMSKQPTIAHVDDSVKVMLSHESKMAKKKGVSTSTTYIPRAEHPLMANQTKNNDNDHTTTTTDGTKLPPSQMTASATTDGTATTTGTETPRTITATEQ